MNNDIEVYTLTQISQITGIPAPTLTDYRNKFGEYIPTQGRGRKRKYEKQAIVVFRFIKEKYEDGFEKEQIENLLIKNFDRNIDVDNEEYEVELMQQPPGEVSPNVSAAMLLNALESFEEYRKQDLIEKQALKEEVIHLRKELEKVNEEASKTRKSIENQIETGISTINDDNRKAEEVLKTEIQSLKESINEVAAARDDADKRDIEILEKVREIQERQHRPWWRKIFGR
mgnify:CR=1 FL=1